MNKLCLKLFFVISIIYSINLKSVNEEIQILANEIEKIIISSGFYKIDAELTTESYNMFIENYKEKIKNIFLFKSIFGVNNLFAAEYVIKNQYNFFYFKLGTNEESKNGKSNIENLIESLDECLKSAAE